MAKALVSYYSRSGNTKAMAKEISKAMEDEGISVELKELSKVTAGDLVRYDVLVFGSPTYYGTMAFQLKQLFDESVAFHGKLDGKIGAAFSSAANIAGGNETTILDILHAFLIHGMIIQGDPKGDHYGPVAIGAPDQRSLSECRRFGQRIALLAKKMFG